MTTFTLANITDVTNMGSVSSAANSFTQTFLSGFIFLTFAGAISVVLVPSLWAPGSEVTVADRANFASRSTNVITITALGGVLIQGASSAVINTQNGSVKIFYDGTTFGISGHNP